MNESKLIETIDALFVFATIFLFMGIISIEPHRTLVSRDPEKKVEHIPFAEEENGAIYNPYIAEELNLRREWQSITITYTTIETEYAGRHYITAYCPEECGYNGSNFPSGWKTSSGAICHYGEEWYEPTTCAIDRRYHSYSEYLLIDGKIYVTEDTGPGVQGLWVDVFRPDYDSMSAFGSHYSDVFYVTFITHRKDGTGHYERVRNYLLCRCVGDRSDYRNGNRTDD